VRTKVRETALRGPRGEQQEGRTCSRRPSRHSPAAPGEHHGRAGVSLQPVERTMVEQMSALKPMEDAVLQQSYPERTAAQVKGPSWCSS